MKRGFTWLGVLAVVLALGGNAWAQKFTFNVTPGGGFTFQPTNTDPDTAPEVYSPTFTIDYSVGGGGSDPQWHISVSATDFTGGPSGPLVSDIRWVGTGQYSSGLHLATTGQTLLASHGKVSGTGTVTFYLANKWSYAPGTYTTTITFTISSP